jgi:hypothetical protein
MDKPLPAAICTFSAPEELTNTIVLALARALRPSSSLSRPGPRFCYRATPRLRNFIRLLSAASDAAGEIEAMALMMQAPA